MLEMLPIDLFVGPLRNCGNLSPCIQFKLYLPVVEVHGAYPSGAFFG